MRDLFYVHPSLFPLLGLAPWIPRLRTLTPCDHDRGVCAFGPEGDRELIGCLDDIKINNRVLHRPETKRLVEQAGGGAAIATFFDEETEALTKSLGLAFCSSPAVACRLLDNKLVMAQLAAALGVPSAPAFLAQAPSVSMLRAMAQAAGFGEDLVIQEPYGHGGTGTVRVRTRDEWADVVVGTTSGSWVRVMPYLTCDEHVIDIFVAGKEVVLGPLTRVLAGHPELTRSFGGWCGDEVGPHVDAGSCVDRMRELAVRLGHGLAQLGFVGCMGVDFLHDVVHDKVYLAEVNPRICGEMVLGPLVATRSAPPVIVRHLAHFAPDVVDLSPGSAREASSGACYSHLLLYQTQPTSIVAPDPVPRTGVWRRTGETVAFSRPADDPSVLDEGEAFWFGTSCPGVATSPDDLLGVVILRERATATVRRSLTESARRWVRDFRAFFGHGGQP